MDNAGQFVDPGKRVRMTPQELAEARDYMEERARIARDGEALVDRVGEVAPVPPATMDQLSRSPSRAELLGGTERPLGEPMIERPVVADLPSPTRQDLPSELGRPIGSTSSSPVPGSSVGRAPSRDELLRDLKRPVPPAANPLYQIRSSRCVDPSRLAGLGNRFCAQVIDGFVNLFVLYVVAYGSLLVVAGAVYGSPGLMFGSGAAVLIALVPVYVQAWKPGAPTLGRLLLGVRLERYSTGEKVIGLWRTVGRSFVYSIGGSVIIGLFSPLMNDERRGWHDISADTIAVRSDRRHER